MSAIQEGEEVYLLAGTAGEAAAVSAVDGDGDVGGSYSAQPGVVDPVIDLDEGREGALLSEDSGESATSTDAESLSTVDGDASSTRTKLFFFQSPRRRRRLRASAFRGRKRRLLRVPRLGGSERSKKIFGRSIRAFWAILGCSFLLVFAVLPEVHEGYYSAQKCLGLLAFVTVFWTAEVVPLYITALCVPVIGTLLRIMPIDEHTPDGMSAPDAALLLFAAMWANSTVYLVLGGFCLAAALNVMRIDRAVVCFVLRRRMMRSPLIFVFVLMVVGLGLSMWLSNVTAPVLSVSVVLPVLQQLPPDCRFIKTVILGIAMGCNIGGMTTPISSPQNAIALSVVESQSSDELSFGTFMFASIPVSLCCLFPAFLFVVLLYRPDIKKVPELPVEEVSVSRSFRLKQIFVIVLIFVTVCLWIAVPWIKGVFGNMGIVALIPVIVLFSTGILGKHDFNSLPWTTIVLVAGGHALGVIVERSLLLEICANSLEYRLGDSATWVKSLVFCVFMTGVACVASHTVAALIVLPVVALVGERLGHCRLFVLSAVLCASAAAALPVSSFPNICAISVQNPNCKRYLRLTDLVKVGAPLTVLGLLVVVSIGFGIMIGLGF